MKKQKLEKCSTSIKANKDILKATGCTVAVKNANLSINEGEIFVIMGLSGSGKSTLLRCINRLIKPTSGEVFIDNINIIRIPDKELLGDSKEKDVNGIPAFRTITAQKCPQQCRIRTRITRYRINKTVKQSKAKYRHRWSQRI